MNMKRAIGIAVLVYIASFILSLLYAALAGVDMTNATDIPTNLYLAGAIISLVLAIGSAWWYFKPNSVKPSAKAGLHFGLALIIVGFIFDTVMIVPYAIANPIPDSSPFVYYANPWFWLTVALVILGATAVGYFLRKK